MNASMEVVKLHPAFNLVSTTELPSLKVRVIHSRHKATGADHYHLESAHDENAFMVAFRTQPADSTGIAHILEHTTLCGSQKYPVRDPFFSMIRRSLNTFMNAFTAADWTAYPFASQNRKDFYNLLDVYLDAVFFPVLHPLDFAQEGIRMEVEEGKPVYKGVVFNEMKGAMSSDNEQLYYALAPHLFPATTYHHNSGGDPAVIPDLTYEQLVKFHRSHYHPSNAVFMTFGNNDLYELQERFEELALNRFSQGVKLRPVPEQRLSAAAVISDTYTSDKPAAENTYQLLAWLLPAVTDTRVRLSLRLLEGILLEDSASPLRHYLETTPLGNAPTSFSGLDDHNYEMVFYAGIQGSAPEHAQLFEQEVLALLQKLADEPVADSTLDAIVHQIELGQREIGGDRTPYGLQLLFNGMTNAIYDSDPVPVWDLEGDLQWLREQIKNKVWVSNLIRTQLLENTHRVRLTLIPDAEKSARLVAQEAERVQNVYASMDNMARQNLVEAAAALKVRQEEQDDISLLPKVGREDIPADLLIAEGVTRPLVAGDVASPPLTTYNAGTNGLYYHYVTLPVTDELLSHPYFPVYTSLFGQLGFGDLSYLESQQLQTATTGGVTMSASVRGTPASPDQTTAWLVINTKALNSKPEAIQLLRDLFMDERFDESSRILDLLDQKVARWETRLAGAGHSLAIQTAGAPLSAVSWYEFQQGGLPALVFLKQLLAKLKSSPEALNEFLAALSALHQQVRQLAPQFVLVAEEQELPGLQAVLQTAWSASPSLPADGQPAVASLPAAPAIPWKQAWIIPTNVQFCADAYRTVPVSHPDAPALMILGGILRNGYLHRAIREQGGAYGGGAGYDANSGIFRFFSYRDPRLAETFTDFEKSIDWLIQHPVSAEQLDEAVLGIIASMDKPGSPAGEAISAHFAQLQQRTPEFRRQLRSRLLQVTPDDVRRVAQTYLQGKTPSRAVLAPSSRRDELTGAGYDVHTLDAVPA